MLSATQIKAAADLPLPFVDVPVPGLAPAGTDPAQAIVRVRALHGFERDRWELLIWKGVPKVKGAVAKRIKATLVAVTAIDERGELLFGADDAEAMDQLPARELNALFDAAARLSGVTKQDEDELVKNSGAAPSGNSGSV